MTKRQARELHDRTANEDDSERDDDDDKVALDRRGAEAQEDTGPSRLLACPYYKRDRTKFKSRRSCPGPGWDSLRRVKSVTPPEPSATRRRHATRTANRIDRREHLYRRHRLEEFGCPRCHEHFKEERYLDAHKQADPPCEVRQPDLLAGLDHAQYCQLRSRKRTRGVSTLEDKWKEVYKILFPGTEEDDIPSPYYDTDPAKGDGGPDDLEDRIRAFERSVRRGLPQYLRQLRDTGQHLGQRDDDPDLEGLGRNIAGWTMERLRQSLPAVRGQGRGHARPADSPVRSPGRDLLPGATTPEPAAQSSQGPEATAQVGNVTSYDPAGMTEYSLVGIGGSFDFDVEQLAALDPKLFVDIDETEGPGDANGLQI